MKRFIGQIIYAENKHTREQRNLDAVLRGGRDKGLKMIGLVRFHAIFRHLIPNNEEFKTLFSLLRTACRQAWCGFGPCAIDESLYEYQPAKATQLEFEAKFDVIPLCYIPRKPHKNGLLNYQASVVHIYKI
jgi:hypothetical protein